MKRLIAMLGQALLYFCVGTVIAAAVGVAIEDECQASADCMGGFCVAPFDPDTLQRSPRTCQFMCVPLLDDTLWCSDDAACCDEDATCTERPSANSTTREIIVVPNGK